MEEEKKIGRKPFPKTKKLIKEICYRLSDGEPLRKICRDAHMPSWPTVYKWMNEDRETFEKVSFAREIGYDAIQEEILDIIDDPKLKTLVDIKRADRRAYYRFQLLSKLSSKFKERVELTGKDGKDLNMSDSERAIKLEAFFKKILEKRKEIDIPTIPVDEREDEENE